MIITYSKHGRTPRDSKNLIAHLLKAENETIEILEIGNSVAQDLAGVVKDMEILRDGSSARAAFHHLSINPSIDYSDAKLLRAAKDLRDELDPEDIRPYIVVAHRKRRENSAEGGVDAQGDRHAH
jgi:hypothetical protein